MPVVLDAVDEQIIAALRRDGRQANTHLARQIGVTEGTVRKRIQRLREAGIVDVRAFVDMRRMGLDWDVIILVNCAYGRIEDVARQLAALDEVRYVALMTGRYDLMVAAFFRSQTELTAFLLERLPAVEGVTRSEMLHRLRALKYDSMRFL
ncbi:Lrp/AsnC family transcriptional regulator [Limobrevibacterium gyesilva]|uniref:Lrp/AsnC family transcriptional regulator n=1 Tax=Limobrevibacterium gyesilva TaxID=2991712 RepID=A0AA41YNM5_9PROT|nr:Lrp/AsnC family transcriptional regulator [Limobrevibacterium gyesilva]MCW3477216.1 Lrp/AsnC family transcriptional regulator [Limobrevibacterium gyesilva]